MPEFSALPELLAPAGSPAALDAAIQAGADAVYFGGSLFNARMGAKNFDSESLRSAISRAHAYGVKCYITLNTLVTDRELQSCLQAAQEYYIAGADALIIADSGVAAAIHRIMPDFPLHASTQASGHNTFAAAELEKLGFSRMVMAREATFSDIHSFTQNSRTELEVFVHGALCVSHSGQCLFSSLVGGRSGNRGECAQPCRLPYTKNGKEFYPLSLKDLCLAKHVPKLIEAGVSSLKIEGRMKPPEYVFAVTSVWRRLLDERRSATDEEIRFLASVFSRGGFTDGYFTNNISNKMLGIRSSEDKHNSGSLPPFEGLTKKVALDITAVFHANEPSKLTLSDGSRSVTVQGDTPQPALTAPMSESDYSRCLTKFGGTPYSVNTITIVADSGLMLPVSRLNSLRRDALRLFDGNARSADVPPFFPLVPQGTKRNIFTARFTTPSQITKSARDFFDRLYLPLECFDGSTDSIIMPPVVFDSEAERTSALLKKAVALGAKHILVGNLGHISIIKQYPLEIHGDFRLNAMNSQTVAVLESFGIDDTILSPELTLPQIRDIKGNTSVIVYGRIPLMLTEKCVISEIIPCNSGLRSTPDFDIVCRAILTDRRGADFPVLRESNHRNVIYNSLPTNMSDRTDDLNSYNISSRHFIFSTENADAVDNVIASYIENKPLPFNVRRINK